MSAVAPETGTKSGSGGAEKGEESGAGIVIPPVAVTVAGAAGARLAGAEPEAKARVVEPAIPAVAVAAAVVVESDGGPPAIQTPDQVELRPPEAGPHAPSGHKPGAKALIRELAKAAVRGLATLAILPQLLTYHIRALFLGRNRALEGSTQLLALIPGVLGQYLRRAFLGRVIERCHETATIEFGTIFSQTGARIDEYAYIGPRCHIGLAHIEHDVLVAAGVHVPSGARTHGTASLGRSIREQPGARTPVRIGAGSWIGSAAVVMADVGCDAVVGAGAVVTKPIPDRVIAGGVPAKVIRARSAEHADVPVVVRREG